MLLNKIKIELIIISLLWISVIFSFYQVNSYDITFIFGIIGLLIVSVTYKKFRDFSFSLLLLFLFFSIFNLINFNYSLKAYIDFFGLQIHVIPFLFFIILLYKKIDKVFQLKYKWLDDDIEEIEKNKNRRIELFKNQFNNLSVEELKRKLDSDILVDEAKIAIQELLNN